MQIAAIAQAGIAKAFDRFEKSAQRTAQISNPDTEVDLGQEVVEQVTAKQELAANIAVMKTADEMIGRLLDIKA